MEPGTLLLLGLAGLIAGFIDSIVGGGGVITLPALLATGMPPHTAVATNKIVGTGASSMATWQYGRGGLLRAPLLIWAMPVAAVASAVGAAVVLRLPEQFVLAAITVVVLAMVAWVLARPQFGTRESRVKHALAIAVTLALVIGFYDGLLGPGTGTFLLFGLVAWAGWPMMAAAANGRAINFASNVGALAYFAAVGAADWATGGIMAIGTVTGGFLGSHAAMRGGHRWVRPLFIVMALLLAGRLVWDLLQ